MRKLLLLLIIISLFVGCSGTKVINDKEHTFYSYVLINSGAEHQTSFIDVPAESFIVNRWLIWNKED